MTPLSELPFPPGYDGKRYVKPPLATSIPGEHQHEEASE